MSVLKKWAEFSGKVTSFGENDGFAAIHTACCTESQLPGILESGWVYRPPHKHIRIEDDGSITDITQKAITESELFENMSKEEYKEYLARSYDDPDPEYPIFIVEAKATINSDRCTYDVRTGFWTRVESRSVEAAVNKTIELWEEESKLSSEQLQILDDAFEKKHYDEVKYTMASMRNQSSIAPLIETLEFHKEVHEVNLLDSMKPRQLWWIARFIRDLEKDTVKLKRLLGGLCSDERLLKFTNTLEAFHYKKQQERKNSPGCTVPAEDVLAQFEKEGAMVEEFLKDWEPEL
jgi:hypothetical protein